MRDQGNRMNPLPAPPLPIVNPFMYGGTHLDPKLFLRLYLNYYWTNLILTLNVGLSMQNLPFKHSPHKFFEDSRLTGSLRKCVKFYKERTYLKKKYYLSKE